MRPLEIVSICDSLGVPFPAEVVERLGLRSNGYLFAEESTDGLRLRKPDAMLEQQTAVARTLMDKHAEVLRQLKD